MSKKKAAYDGKWGEINARQNYLIMQAAMPGSHLAGGKQYRLDLKGDSELQRMRRELDDIGSKGEADFMDPGPAPTAEDPAVAAAAAEERKRSKGRASTVLTAQGRKSGSVAKSLGLDGGAGVAKRSLLGT